MKCAKLGLLIACDFADGYHHVPGVNPESVGERLKDCGGEMEFALLPKDSGQCDGHYGESGWTVRVPL